MLYWIPYAFLRIVVFFIGGILLGLYAPGFLSFRTAAVAFVGLNLFYFLLWYVNSLKKKVIVNTGFAGLLAIFLAGYLNVIGHDEKRTPDHINHADEKIDFFQG